MTNFKYAITKTPAQSLINGLTLNETPVKPDYHRAIQQHQNYITALKTAGLEVQTLPASEEFPDSCFTEDIAVLAPEFAILTRPGAETRRDEITTVPNLLSDHYQPENIHVVTEPALLEGGDVMLIDKHFYIGLSKRTNKAGINQFADIASQYGYHVTTVPVTYSLHLKTGVTYLGNNQLVMTSDYFDEPAFQSFGKIVTPDEEKDAANIIRINDAILIPDGHSKTRALIEQFSSSNENTDNGTKILPINISEFAKIDGGLTCLSLRF